MINTSQRITILAMDGLPLCATWYSCEQKNAPICILAPAMAVHRRYYDAFCAYLCSAGFDVVSFDYRGAGDTALSNDIAVKSSFRSCGELDLEAVIQFAAKRSEKLFLIGHSLGIQALGFAPSNVKIQRVISVASGSGYYGWVPMPKRIARYMLLCFLMPLLAKIFGYFPGKRLGILSNIPGRMAIEWSALCRTPGYLRQTTASAPEPNFSMLEAKMLVMSFTDDNVMPKAAIDDLHENYCNAQRERIHLTPCALGFEKIGHLGAFREANQALWKRWVVWLSAENPAYSNR
jgi:predicted alpha/beta hydrolase